MKENLALVIEKPGKIRLEERPIREPGPGEVLVEVDYVALCGSDVKLYAGSYTAPHRYPVVVGHEWLGRVAKAGPDVSLAPGDLVTGDCSVFCGQCPMCDVNRNHCEKIEKSGITVDGKCSRYVTLNARHVYKCPPMAEAKPLVLTEPMSVSVTGITTRVPGAALQRAKKAAVLGAGGIGLLAALVLCEYPIEEITLVDISPEKLAFAQGFGLPQLRVANDAASLPADGFDIVVEAAGAAATLQACPRLAAPAGHIVMLGHQKEVALDFGAVIKKSLTLHASNGSTGGFEKAMDIIAKRNDIVGRLITKTVPLEEAPDYIANRMKDEQNIKVVIDLR